MDPQNDYSDLLGVVDKQHHQFVWTQKRKQILAAFITYEGNIERVSSDLGVPLGEIRTLLQRETFRKAIREHAERQMEIAGESDVTILARLVNISKGNIYDYFRLGPGGVPQLKKMDELTNAEKLRVRKLHIKPTQYGYEEIIELHDAQAANEKLLKYLGYDRGDGQLTPEEFAARAMLAVTAMMRSEALERSVVDSQ